MKITKREIDKIVPDAKRFRVMDSELPGFGLRIEPSCCAEDFKFRGIYRSFLNSISSNDFDTLSISQ